MILMDILNKDSLKIIIFRTDRLGDLILSLPVIENLHQAYPKAQIDLFVNPYTVSLAKLQKNIRYAWPDIYPGFLGLKPLVSWLRSRQYDIALYLYPRPRLALAGFLAAIPVRIGTKYRYYSLLFNRRIPLHRSRSNRHERDLNLQLLQQGLSIPEQQTDTGLRIPEQTHQAVDSLLLKKGIAAEDPYIVIHPGSGGSSLTWPHESFRLLAQMLAGKGSTILLTGTDQDREIIEKIKFPSHQETLIDMSGQLDLTLLAALLNRATLARSRAASPSAWVRRAYSSARVSCTREPTTGTSGSAPTAGAPGTTSRRSSRG